MATVQIVNPQPGGKKYTSEKRAQSFVLRGLAIIDNGMLRFFTGSPADVHRAKMLQKQLREAAGMCFWNGSGKDVTAMHRPGEVRS
jgi:hypothetical protein